MYSHFIQKLKDNYIYFGGISFLYGIFFVFCLFENFSGITFPLCVIGTLYVYYLFMKKIELKIKKRSIRYGAGMILLGFANSYTSNPFFIFFNTVGILLLFIIFMIQQFYDDRMWKTPLYIQNMFITVGTFFTQILSPFTDGIKTMKKERKPDEKRDKTVRGIVIGIFISVPILLIVLPLLLSSDMIFTRIFNNIFRLPHFNLLNIDRQIRIFFMFLTGVICCYGFFRGMCHGNLKKENKEWERAGSVIGITINSILAVLYVSYCLVQIFYLFIGFENGLPAGITYSEYARSGFFELLFVGFINFFLVLICNAVFENNKILKTLLFIISGCTFIMIGSSAYRMILYVGQYHLTFLRVLVLWFLFVLILFMAGLARSIVKEEFPLFRYMVTVVMCCYIALTLSRPDTFITKYNLSRGNVTLEDVQDIMYNGGYDNVPIIAGLDLVKDMGIENDAEEYTMIESQIVYYMEDVLDETDSAEDAGLRKWNYSEYKAKKAARKYIQKIYGIGE